MAQNEPVGQDNLEGKEVVDCLLLLHPDDNCLVSCQTLPSVRSVVIDDQEVVLTGGLTLGHKLARLPLKEGDKVIKYGVAIGSATRAIGVGESIHIHNMKSDYLPTYAIGNVVEQEG